MAVNSIRGTTGSSSVGQTLFSYSELANIIPISSPPATFSYVAWAISQGKTKANILSGTQYLDYIASNGYTTYRDSSGNYFAYKEFTSGTTTWNAGPFNGTNADVLVVAGGGAGGSHHAGGGGAGGYRYETNVAVSGNQTVTVGNGGLSVQATDIRGANGQNSVFGSITAIGGGGGGAWSGDPTRNGSAGGSGGGGSLGPSGSTWSNGGTGTSGQGNNGGRGRHDSNHVGGGGGGAGAAGADGSWGTGSRGGAGGGGLSNSITGVTKFYAGGGGGGSGESNPGGTGGNGGGGFGGTYMYKASDGIANTGGGGGGGWSVSFMGGHGGSGVVVVRFPLSFPAGSI
jgi:hypothetical protein